MRATFTLATDRKRESESKRVARKGDRGREREKSISRSPLERIGKQTDAKQHQPNISFQVISKSTVRLEWRDKKSNLFIETPSFVRLSCCLVVV